jgi:acetyl esterase/lipase
MNCFLSVVNALYLLKLKSLVRKDTITGPDGHQIPLLIFTPKYLGSPCPALVYYAGGGFTFKYAPPHIANVARYAQDANCIVVLTSYRLAPTHTFPTGFNDGYAALQWVFSNSAELGVDKERIAVGGDSAGGAIAGGVAQKAAQQGGLKLCGQMLIYPAADTTEGPSVQQFSSVQPFKDIPLTAVWEAYLGHKLPADTSRYAVLVDGDASGVAPAYVETAEFDVLRDGGNAYAEALVIGGIPVTLNATKGTVHGFDLLAAKSSISKAAMQSRIDFLRKIFRKDA